MIAVDTNILVRYAVKDDPEQTVVATDFLGTHRCFILKTVLLELVWVLGSSRGYALARQVVVERIRHILGLPEMIVQDPEHVGLAMDWYEAGMDFADALHLASNERVEAFATFEKKILTKATQLHLPHQIILLPTK
jgi:predicted nucleic-acid-binding protein